MAAANRHGMKLSMALHLLHECPMSRIAAKQRHGLAHPVGHGGLFVAQRFQIKSKCSITLIILIMSISFIIWVIMITKVILII